MAALNHPDRIARLIIVNAPHPFVFQKTLFDDMAQREASQYITAFRNPELEKYIDAIGLERVLRRQLHAAHRFRQGAPTKSRPISTQWGQPGAMTAMLNWYRASAVDRARDGRDARAARVPRRPFPPRHPADAGDLGHGRQGAAADPARGLDALVPDLTIDAASEVDAGHFVPWEENRARSGG